MLNDKLRAFESSSENSHQNTEMMALEMAIEEETTWLCTLRL